MKAFVVLGLLAAEVIAFPFMMDSLLGPLASEALSKRQSAPPQGAGALPATPPPFNATLQRISTTGAHAFVPPGPNDARGECPGLNALANHNYLPHNGVATIPQFINATNTVFGMGLDLATFLAVFGAVVDGTLTSWSIGGLPHTGILGSHNNYETDSSPIKSDLNQYGSNTRFIMSQFMTLYNSQPNAATANYNLEVMRTFRGKRFTESVNKNPYFAYFPFTGVEVSQAAFTFIYRFMSNKSAEYPEGILNKNVLKSFMAVTGPENNLTHTPGYERIPDNWYKRHPSDVYTIPYFQTDILYFAQTIPQILTIGCNKGTVNSYSPIDPAVISSGAYTASQVQAKPICFASEFAIAEIPLITGLSSSTTAPLISLLRASIASLKCNTIGSVNQSALTACPGFSFYGGPTGPVAPGAIQS